MRGIAFSRLVAARALLAGALIAGVSRPAPARTDQATPEETALAMPRVKLPAGNDALGMPQPLPAGDAARIRRILAEQRAGQMPRAIAETGELNDLTLLGGLLADRLLRTHATAPAFAAWLGRHADLPDAPAVYARLLTRLPRFAPRPPAPADAALAGAASPDCPSDAGAARDAFTRGRDAAAFRVAVAQWRRSRGRNGQAAYLAGLAAWRQARFAVARPWFESASFARCAGSGLRAAGALWAARALMREGDPEWRPWMQRAADEPATLHGRLARRILGIADPPRPLRPVLAEADLEAIAATPSGRRAFAWLQVGEPARAEAELRALWPRVAGTPRALALLLVARATGMGGLTADLAAALGMDEPAVRRLRPSGGFLVDPALVYAVARVESNFDPRAGSDMGAHGLMQLRADAVSAVGAPARANLRDPGTNLRLGQRYLAYLSTRTDAGDDLLRVLAAYNAGPGALASWRPETGDPLLFLEALPSDETRRYVQATLLYLWSYAARLGLASPSLDAMAKGEWPRFSAELARLH